MGSRRSGRWLKSFLETVGFILSGFRLERSRGDPIHAPEKLSITTLFREPSNLPYTALGNSGTLLERCVSTS